MFKDVTKVGEPIIIAGVFFHSRQSKVTFSAFKGLVQDALKEFGESIDETAIIETDGCGVLGPVMEEWMPLAFHG